MKKVYNRVLDFASHPQAPVALFLVAFIESSIFPIPPDILLIPMVLVAFDRAFYYAFICTLGSVLGGIAGYAIGYFLYGTVGTLIVDFYNLAEQFDVLRTWYSEYDVFVVMAAGFSPIPYKVFTILSGVMQSDIIQFIGASIISRGARFFLIAWLLWRGGPRFKGWIEKNFYPLTMAATVVLIMFFVLFKLILAR